MINFNASVVFILYLLEAPSRTPPKGEEKELAFVDLYFVMILHSNGQIFKIL